MGNFSYAQRLVSSRVESLQLSAAACRARHVHAGRPLPAPRRSRGIRWRGCRWRRRRVRSLLRGSALTRCAGAVYGTYEAFRFQARRGCVQVLRRPRSPPLGWLLPCRAGTRPGEAQVRGQDHHQQRGALQPLPRSRQPAPVRPAAMTTTRSAHDAGTGVGVVAGRGRAGAAAGKCPARRADSLLAPCAACCARYAPRAVCLSSTRRCSRRAIHGVWARGALNLRATE